MISKYQKSIFFLILTFGFLSGCTNQSQNSNTECNDVCCGEGCKGTNIGTTAHIFEYDTFEQLNNVLKYRSTDCEYLDISCSSLSNAKYRLFAMLYGTQDDLLERKMEEITPFITSIVDYKKIHVFLPMNDEYKLDNLVWSKTTDINQYWEREFQKNISNEKEASQFRAITEVYYGYPNYNDKSCFYARLTDGEKLVTNVVGDISLRDYFEENKNTIVDAIKTAIQNKDRNITFI